MNDSAPESLIRDLLEWLEKRDRTYEEVMDAWGTSRVPNCQFGRMQMIADSS